MFEVLAAHLGVLEASWKTVMAFPGEQGWLSPISNRSGWYLISATIPMSVFESLPSPVDPKHYCLSERIRSAQVLKDAGLLCPLVLYSGEACKIKDRLRAHFTQPKGNACLALGQYPELQRYPWTVQIAYCSEVFPNIGFDKGFRKVLEQAWRSQHGWPMLCSG